tara:strand:+ start:286 stop:1326 length:1041 start_codon:yes stop_codon:yes gene_type:complete
MIKNVSRILEWSPPAEWLEIKTIDAHTGGEPLRVIIDGYPRLSGNTILEMRQNAKENFDYIRKALILEPRGHADMYGAIITPPETNESDFGVIFMHNDGYSTGCGHAVIAIAKIFVEMELVKKHEPETIIRMDVPSGSITAFAHVENSKVLSIRFINVPSFVEILDGEIEIPKYGKIKFDLAFGGAYYAIVSADDLELNPNNINMVIKLGMLIKNSINNQEKIIHPQEPEMNFLYGTIFTLKPSNKNNHSRNICVFANGEIDRSPTGTGVSARAAVHYARDEISIGETITIESIIGSTFDLSVIEETNVGEKNAIIPQVVGTANIIGKNTFWIDPLDEKGQGFFLR